MKWKVNFYHTEGQFRAGNVVMFYERNASRESVVNEGKALAKARGDYTFEVIRIE